MGAQHRPKTRQSARKCRPHRHRTHHSTAHSTAQRTQHTAHSTDATHRHIHRHSTQITAHNKARSQSCNAAHTPRHGGGTAERAGSRVPSMHGWGVPSMHGEQRAEMMKTMEVMSEPLHPPGEHLVVCGHGFPAEGASGTAQLDCTIWIARLHIWIASTNQHPLKIKMPEDGIKKITKK